MCDGIFRVRGAALKAALQDLPSNMLSMMDLFVGVSHQNLHRLIPSFRHAFSRNDGEGLRPEIPFSKAHDSYGLPPKSVISSGYEKQIT